ncbi:MAG: class I SAM-dependent methyltransferase [Mariniphaga sp.]|nr:class I SAM-dependent methyltransferase [Mariniphaga sp.]
MADSQNKFYTSISKYYSEIFPYNPAQLQFVKRHAIDVTGQQILDIGCATGELAFQLAKSGAVVTGIDLNEDLLQQAKAGKMHPKLTFQKGDMLELKSNFQSETFDKVLCFGNTLVHLTSHKLILDMLRGVNTVLKPGGFFLLQILNYDYILSEPVTELPLIETENIKFVRHYAMEENNPVISFQTELHLKKEGEVIFNETPLLALKSGELKNLLLEAGIVDVGFYANFKKEPFGGKHIPLVAKAVKPV